MPNWCYNSLRLSNDDKSKIDALEAELEKDNASVFNHLRPNPSGEWQYDWSVNNWGTKWDTSPSDWTRENDNTISMSFDTAWAPPIALYEFLCSEGWVLSAMYHEPGMCFIGSFDDELDSYYEYDCTDRESVENLPQDLQDFGGLMEEIERYEQEQYDEMVSELERTAWFDSNTNPHYVGRYEVKSEAWPYPQFCNWDGEKWSRWADDNIIITEWRGLVEEYKESV